MKKTDDESSIKLRPPFKHDFDVGYAKPPTESQFQPGRSGNPKGRPRGSRSKVRVRPIEELGDIVLREARRKIRVQEGGRTVRLSIAEATMRSIAVAAVKGQPRAQRLMTQMLGLAEADKRRDREEIFKSLVNYKVGWGEELARRKHEGIVAPDPIPHPSQIKLDFKTGEARVEGPLTAEEKIIWDDFRERKRSCLDEIVLLKEDLAVEHDPEIRAIIEGQLDYCHEMLGIVSQLIKD